MTHARAANHGAASAVCGAHAMNTWLTIEEARALYAAGDAAHDFDHVHRVATMAQRIAAAEGADLVTVWLAALLHDIPPPASAGDLRLAHHLQAASYAQTLLTARGVPADRVAAVVHCIEVHRYREQSVTPRTLEARCLYDADKLDSIGAIGVARTFAYAGAHGSRLWTAPAAEIAATVAEQTAPDYTPVHEYVFKLCRLLDTLYTPTARAIGAARHAAMVAFFAQLDREMLG